MHGRLAYHFGGIAADLALAVHISCRDCRPFLVVDSTNSKQGERFPMTTIVIVFFASFAVVAAAMMAIVWVVGVHAELKARNEKQNRRAIDESYATWQRNREMIVY
jgi:hypothetical protein